MFDLKINVSQIHLASSLTLETVFKEMFRMGTRHNIVKTYVEHNLTYLRCYVLNVVLYINTFLTEKKISSILRQRFFFQHKCRIFLCF